MFISPVSVVRTSHRCIGHQIRCALRLATKLSFESAPGALIAWSVGYPSVGHFFNIIYASS